MSLEMCRLSALLAASRNSLAVAVHRLRRRTERVRAAAAAVREATAAQARAAAAVRLAVEQSDSTGSDASSGTDSSDRSTSVSDDETPSVQQQRLRRRLRRHVERSPSHRGKGYASKGKLGMIRNRFCLENGDDPRAVCWNKYCMRCRRLREEGYGRGSPPDTDSDGAKA